MADWTPPKDAVEAARDAIKADTSHGVYWSSFRHFGHATCEQEAEARAVLSSAPVRELLEALRDEHNCHVPTYDAEVVTTGADDYYDRACEWPCEVCDLLSRWAPKDGEGLVYRCRARWAQEGEA